MIQINIKATDEKDHLKKELSKEIFRLQDELKVQQKKCVELELNNK